MAFDTAALDVAAVGQGITLLSGDCRTVLPTLAANSVQCCVTSPPYYGLRDYGTAQWDGGDAACDHVDPCGAGNTPSSSSTLTTNGGKGPQAGDKYSAGAARGQFRSICGKCGARRSDAQIGLEATPDEFIAQMVAVFRELRRVLRDDGTLWLNLGDSYAGGIQQAAARSGEYLGDGGKAPPNVRNRNGIGAAVGYKPKDLMMMPARVALALQADGWWLRSAIVWAKPNPMPESVTDRPTSAYEMVYLLTKRARYYYDSDAIRERVGEETRRNTEFRGESTPYKDHQSHGNTGDIKTYAPQGVPSLEGRNCRNVWTIATSPFSAAHFATFPPELAERCIKAGTSERGCCAACGAPWVRVTEHEYHKHRPSGGTQSRADRGNKVHDGGFGGWGSFGTNLRKDVTTTGWAPTCKCDAPTQPCTILDPFAGAGTALLVADRLQRNAIGIELNTAYTEMAMERCRADAPLFSSWPPAEDPADQRMAADAMQRDLFELGA